MRIQVNCCIAFNTHLLFAKKLEFQNRALGVSLMPTLFLQFDGSDPTKSKDYIYS